MVTIGLTGGIGSGKSTVARIWQQMGAYVMYADDVAKQLMTEDKQVREALVHAFGQEVYQDDGSLNRPYLISEAFENNRVEELNQIVHPAVYRKTAELIKIKQQEGVKAFVKEAALMLQNGRPKLFDVIVLCEASESLRISRVSQRDNSDSDKVKLRINKQQDFDALKPLADYKIENNGTLAELEHKAERLFMKILTTQTQQ